MSPYTYIRKDPNITLERASNDASLVHTQLRNIKDLNALCEVPLFCLFLICHLLGLFDIHSSYIRKWINIPIPIYFSLLLCLQKSATAFLHCFLSHVLFLSWKALSGFNSPSCPYFLVLL